MRVTPYSHCCESLTRVTLFLVSVCRWTKDPAVRRDGYEGISGKVVHARLSIQPHFGNRLVNAAKPAQRDDGSVAGLCACPCPTLLGGIPDHVPGYRRLSPLHTGDCQFTRMGDMLSPLYLRDGNCTHTKTKLG